LKNLGFIQAYVFQMEVAPTTKRIHAQLCFQTDKWFKRMDLAKLIGGHIQECTYKKGLWKRLTDYCTKEETRLEENRGLVRNRFPDKGVYKWSIPKFVFQVDL